MTLKEILKPLPLYIPRVQRQGGASEENRADTGIAAVQQLARLPCLAIGPSRPLLREMRIHDGDFAGRTDLNNRGLRR